MEITFVPEKSEFSHWEAVYFEGERVGRVVPYIAERWTAFIEEENHFTMSEGNKGMEAFKTKEDAASRLINLYLIRKAAQ